MIIEPGRIRNILCFRNDRFGEFLLNIPAFRALKKNYLGARLVLIVNPYVKDLALAIDSVDEVMTWENRKHKIGEIIKFSKRLKSEKLDLCVIFNPSKEFNIIAFLARIPVRVGYNRKLGFLLTHKMRDEKYLGQKHEIEYNLELACLAGAKREDKTLSLSIDGHILDDLSKEFNIENHNDLVALHPWTSDPVKQWPLQNFSELAKSLLRERDIKVVIIGGKDEFVKSVEFCSSLKQGNIINITGRTTLRQLAALLKKCKLLISGDSGPVHLASCVGTAVIAIFRSDMPAKSSIRWGPVSKGSIVVERNNLLEISVNEVFTKAKGLLNI